MALLGYLAFALNSLVHAGFAFYFVLILKVIVPIDAWQRRCDRALLGISRAWSEWNTRIFEWRGLKLETSFAPGVELRRDRKYLIIPNHQSWVDIFVMQAVVQPRTTFLTFFLKEQLKWVPIFGPIWWALNYPFMKRHTPEFLAKYPERRGEDLQTTRRLCQRMRGKPYAIINFVEGTRRTPAKAAKSPYANLLAPKAGGIATALAALDYDFDAVLDVTIAYTTKATRFADLFGGRIGRVRVHVAEIPLAEIPRGDYFRDEAFAVTFREWLNTYWRRKDAFVGELQRDATKAA